MPDPLKEGRMPILLEGIHKVRERFGDSVFICGHAPAPFSAVALLLGIEPTMMLVYDDPSLLRDFMRFLTQLAVWAAICSIPAKACRLQLRL
jgi:uroporphyrinogen decarboxylase